MLKSAPQVSEANAFISTALAQSFIIFPSMDCAVKSNSKIVSKLDALKEKIMEFENYILAKKQATQIANRH